MEQITLQKTRKKLSAYFAAIVFLIVLFLGILFLSIRYINGHNIESRSFISQSNILLQQLGQDIDILSLFGLEEERFDDDFIGKKSRKNTPKQLSYLVLNNENEIVQKQILQDIDFGILSWKFEPWFWKDDGVLFRKEYLDDPISGDKVIMFMKHKFDFEDYLEDIFWYFILATLFGIWFYYIGLLFVGKTLKPVAENMDDMKNFIHNAGHELKTPIAVVDSNLQLLAKLKNPDSELITESRSEVSRLNRLVESLVDLADISRQAKTKNIDIEKEISSILAEYSSQIKQKKLKTHTSFKKKLKVKSNPGYMQIFLSNLIENAIKYNQDGWALHVSYDGDVFSISDTGVWMSSAEQKKIFDRFYQTSAARTGTWFGIWLSLVKKIADIYDWKIEIKSKKWKWTQFDISF